VHPCISLIGFASTGKSAIGKRVAEKLGVGFVDLDEYIIQHYDQGKFTDIRTLYKELGERQFRNVETEYLRQLIDEHCAEHQLVLATGGGAALSAENATLLKNNSVVVYLYASAAVLYSRMRKKGLPAWIDPAKGLSGVEAALATRDQRYRQLSDIVINNNQQSIEYVVSAIVKEVQQHGK